MKNLKHKRLNTFEPQIACYMKVSATFDSGMILSKFLIELSVTVRATCICVNVNPYAYMNSYVYYTFSIIQLTYRQNSVYGFPKSSQMSFTNNLQRR